MNKRGWLYTVFGLVFYLLFIIIEIPAAWLAWGLNYYTHSTVRLDPLSGSLWHGKGQLVIYYPQNTPHDFGLTEWNINPLWLLAGHIQLSLQTDTPDRQIKTTLGIAKGSLSIKDTDAAFPASFASQFYPPATLFGPLGQLRLRTPSLNFSQQNLEGNATLEWKGAGSSLSNVQPLGDYRLEISSAGKNMNLKLTTVSGDLDITGQGQWQLANGKIQFKGTAMPRERAVEMEPLLKLLGDDKGNGTRQIVYNFNIPLLRY